MCAALGTAFISVVHFLQADRFFGVSNSTVGKNINGESPGDVISLLFLQGDNNEVDGLPSPVPERDGSFSLFEDTAFTENTRETNGTGLSTICQHDGNPHLLICLGVTQGLPRLSIWSLTMSGKLNALRVCPTIDLHSS